MVHAGEILHGKTSSLRHDSRGIYAGIAQDLPVTRYHSLAGTHPSLPACLEVSSWVANGPHGDKGVIMGVRHKEYTVEGVQFHPESILTAEGRTMFRNFLQMHGGTWSENEAYVRDDTSSTTFSVVDRSKPRSKGVITNGTSNILEKIYDHRRIAVEEQMQIPSLRQQDLQNAYDLDLAPSLIDFPDRLRRSPFNISLMAEIKRASPSKGVISLSTSAPQQARTYARAGASVISVLTEPEWFKGSIEDLRTVRQALDGMPGRPAVLRKDFIFNEYQILEGRLAGADTVLLIVKMLSKEILETLYRYSVSLGMEPLVEVNTPDEMKIALELGARVIGVNNRNLTSFEVDLHTTSRLMDMVPKETIVCALSGISGRADVEKYQRDGVGAVLVGEALMRATDTRVFIEDLLGSVKSTSQQSEPEERLVKICGTRTPEAAEAAILAGADLIGVIFVTGRKRCVSQSQGLQIAHTVHNTAKPKKATSSPMTDESYITALDYFQTTASNLHRSDRALLVGVFQDQPLATILEHIRIYNLDIVQLHGSEPLEWATLIPVPVFRSFKPGDAGISKRGLHSLPLLDSASGGSGTQLDLSSVIDTLERDDGLRVILAGGLNAENIRGILERLGQAGRSVVAVDVSSGVEQDGTQNLEKIRAFVKAAKGR